MVTGNKKDAEFESRFFCGITVSELENRNF